MAFVTGLPAIDRMLVDVPRGAVGVLGARPGIGKTTLALDITRRRLLANERVVYFSLEMTAEDLRARIELPEYDVKDPYQFVISDTPAVDFLAIQGLVKRLQVDLIVVDYVDLIDFSNAPRYTSSERLAVFMSNLQHLAQLMGAQVLLLSQLNRNPGNGLPQLTDLRANSALVKQADFVLLLSGDESGYDLQVAKNRHGSIGQLALERVGSSLSTLSFQALGAVRDVALPNKPSKDKPLPPRIITVRKLRQDLDEILAAVERTGQPVLISRHGKLIAKLTPVDGNQIISDGLQRLMDQQDEGADDEPDNQSE